MICPVSECLILGTYSSRLNLPDVAESCKDDQGKNRREVPALTGTSPKRGTARKNQLHLGGGGVR